MGVDIDPCPRRRPAGQEVDLTMHDGTVRDLCFIEDMSNKSSLLISGGAGDCKIYVTDCVTGTPFQALSGHSGQCGALGGGGADGGPSGHSVGQGNPLPGTLR